MKSVASYSFLSILLAAFISVSCSSSQIFQKTKTEISEKIIQYYDKKDKEISVKFLKFNQENAKTVKVLVKLTWPNFATLGKNVDVVVRKEDAGWEVISEMDK
ncbi:MAG: hypothetical protein P9M03_03450 [Candidatus Theseobacter exili]|nr:hypothetical protein [Candidatus Theseobacter exili]